MASQKTYSESDQIGEEGQRLAASTITQLGHIWHDRRIDHGIDGQVELVDPVSRAVLNVQVMVQSKATAGQFASETESAFHFLLSAADIKYWKGGASKVVVMCSKPREGSVWWAPVERAVPPGPGRKSWRLDFDKDMDLLDERSVGRMLLWAADATPGRAVSGRQRQAETLETNLVRLLEMPAEIFFGPSWKPTPRQLGPALRESGYYRSDWIMRGGVVYTFTRPEPHGLGAFLDGGYETVETTEWAESKDVATLANFVDLLRQGLLDQEHRKLWYHRNKRYFMFRAPPSGKDLKVKVAHSKSGRTVVQCYFKDTGRTEIKDYRHYAADVRFVCTDEGWAAEVNPTYHFTFDGKRDLPWGADRLKGIKRLEKNQAVRSTVQFWADYLARPAQLGDADRPLRFGTLITLGVEIGINDKAWRPIKDESETNPEQPQQQRLVP